MVEQKDDNVSIAHSEKHLDEGQQLEELEQASQEYLQNRKGFHFPQWQFKTEKQATIVLAAFASLGGMLSGVDQSVISGANLYMPGDLSLDDNQSSLVSSFVPLGAVFGSILISPCNEQFGRRYSLMIAILFYTIGAILEAAANNFAVMLAGRLFIGFGLGLEGGTVPMYVAESVPSRKRGSIVSLYQFNIALGEVFGYAIAAMFVDVKGNWRYMLGSSLVFSTLMLVGLLFLPETPRYLLHKKREVEAYIVWKNIRKFDTFENRMEFLDTRATTLMEVAANEDLTAERKHLWMDFFTVRRCRNAFIHANIMILLGQMTGINAIMYYLSKLMNQVGFDKKTSVFMSLVGGGSLLLGCLPGVFYMDKFGRRGFANFTLPGFFIGLVLIGISYQFDITTQLATAEGLYLTGIIIYQGFFGSYACLTWVVPSESYPTYLRSYGMTISSGSLFLYAFIVTYNFTRMQESMTPTGLTLGFYGSIAVVGWFYQLLFMPETKGKTLEELDDVFAMPTSERVKNNLQSIKNALLFRKN